MPLTPIEFDLLLLFARNRNIALYDALGSVWGADFLGESRTVDIHISQLRKKTGLNIVSVSKSATGWRDDAMKIRLRLALISIALTCAASMAACGALL